ncbi:helix-turn-helix transcriptional regulator [Paenibacillus sp. FA6]|uniref:helix-turn-helix transcriptional regulator n=1 Tax=Paenibacillus sp. FA6 TaxID=3413029 RepID=UPI003F65583C
MENNNVHLLVKYYPMASFIASIVGPKCEVVVHDISNPERSIVHIENGHISGRKVGDGSTDLVLKILKGGAYHEQQFISNYKGKGSLGQTFRSSTYFIKNESGVLVGMMCLNIDVTHLDTAAQWIQDLLEGGGAFPPSPKVLESGAVEKPVSEYLQGNMDDLLEHMIETVMSRTAVSPERLSAQEKMELIKEFNDEGVFLLKGGVVQVAKACNMSEPTVYRYLQKVKD